MKIIKEIKFQYINDCLKKQGNADDNIESIKLFSNYHFVELNKNDFLNLCFLDNKEVKTITENGRKLYNVTKTAIDCLKNNNGDLSRNWKISNIYNETIFGIDNDGEVSLQPLVLRDTNEDEKKCNAIFYIQDGNHRCLGYCMYLLNNYGSQYTPQKAYLATDNKIVVSPNIC